MFLLQPKNLFNVFTPASGVELSRLGVLLLSAFRESFLEESKK